MSRTKLDIMFKNLELMVGSTDKIIDRLVKCEEQIDSLQAENKELKKTMVTNNNNSPHLDTLLKMTPSLVSILTNLPTSTAHTKHRDLVIPLVEAITNLINGEGVYYKIDLSR